MLIIYAFLSATLFRIGCVIMKERLSLKQVRELEQKVNIEARRCHLYVNRGYKVEGIGTTYFLYYEHREIAEGSLRTIYTALKAIISVLQLI